MKRILAFMTAIFMAFVAAGCGGNEPESAGSAEEVVTWHMMFQEQEDLQMVEDEINNRIGDKLGAKLDIIRIDPSSYTQKMQIMFAASEVFDLCWMSPGTGYNSFVEKGALMPMNSLIEQYAPKSYAAIPENFWDAARINGEIYGFLNYQIVGRQFGYVLQQDMLDESGFDPSTIEEYTDIEPLLAYIHENHPEYMAIGIIGASFYENLMSLNHMEQIITGVGYRTDGDTIEIINLYEQPEYLELCRVMRDWYNKGYIEKDAATITNSLELRKKGIVKTWWDMTGPGFEPTFETGCGGRPVQTKLVVPPTITSGNITATMNSIAKTSTHPEKAMQLLEMVNQNEEDIYNLLCFGIEDVHYTKTGEKRIEMKPDAKYNPNIAWAWGNQFNAYLQPGQDDDLWEKTKELNNTAEQSKLLGFSFDSENVKSEVSQVTSVITEYDSLLGTGTVDPDTMYQEFIDKLKSAGIDNLIAEVQTQVDTWLENKAS